MMLRLYDYGDPFGMKGFLDAIGDLSRHGFLGLKATRISIQNTCKLANAHDTVFRQVGYVSGASDRHNVMFAV